VNENKKMSGIIVSNKKSVSGFTQIRFFVKQQKDFF